MKPGKTEGYWRWCYKRCSCCLSEEERNAIAVDNEINLDLAEQRREERRQIKVLLLGTRESGKTTFIRQMRIIHGKVFSEEDRRAYAKLVFQNVFTAMKALIGAMTNLKISYANPQNEMYAQQFQEVDIEQMTQLNRMYVEAIHRLWHDRGIELCYSRRSEYQLLDYTEYFMTNLDRIAATDYIPTNQDMLRVQRSGIDDCSFDVEPITMRFVEVSSQKSERRKWIHCFENVECVVFLASLSEYLEENNRESRIKESLSLFYNTIHSKWFAKSSIILFLNKKDILAENIQTSDLQTYFPDFQGKRQDAQEAMEYIAKMYMQQAVNVENKNWKSIYTNFICVTDLDDVRKASHIIKNTLIEVSMTRSHYTLL